MQKAVLTDSKGCFYFYETRISYEVSYKSKNSRNQIPAVFARSDKIRTCGLRLPKTAL